MKIEDIQIFKKTLHPFKIKIKLKIARHANMIKSIDINTKKGGELRTATTNKTINNHQILIPHLHLKQTQKKIQTRRLSNGR